MLLCRRLQLLIDKLKKSKDKDLETHNVAEDCCSETYTEGNNHLSESRSDACCSPEISKLNSSRSNSVASVEGLDDDVPLISLLRSSKNSPKMKAAQLEKHNISIQPIKVLPKSLSTSTNNPQTGVSRKRVRVILSDDESEVPDEVERLKGRPDKCPVEVVATSDECRFKLICALDFLLYKQGTDCISYLVAVKSRGNSASHDCKFQVSKSLEILDQIQCSSWSVGVWCLVL